MAAVHGEESTTIKAAADRGQPDTARHSGDRSSSEGKKRDAPDDGDDNDEEWLQWRNARRKAKVADGASGLFLETINRYMLDFDFEKLCSVSLSNLNVYACLVCGKYFQGRGPTTHAYLHSLQEDHHVFINLESLKIYILPDGNEVFDASLNDIKYVLWPTFTAKQIESMDLNTAYAYDLNNKGYLPGFVGLNNIKANDYMNVVFQALTHVKPLRDFFLKVEPSSSSELCKRFGLLLRKIWNPRAFKGQVSPHELVQEISNASKKRFRLSEQSDPIEFLVWFLNSLHVGLGGTKKNGSSIIHQVFQGEVRVESGKIAADGKTAAFYTPKETETTQNPFLFLALDLPPPPLFQDDLEKSIIPQVPLTTLLTRFDGTTWKETSTAMKRMKITRVPKFLILHMKRFYKNNFSKEKNPTIVNFPIKNVDMSDYIEGAMPGEYKYDLVANICHEGGRPGASSGEYKVHVHSKGRDQWFQIQDLFVEEIAPQMIFLSESYIQIWEQI
ncbi:hypothetical protein DFJ73DRAFT_264777 [Zopfochytrium polystomum]|nr:hypothetical protein DFJ73DRAFT_264777 [Zopfochytrium polystomum]